MLLFRSLPVPSLKSPMMSRHRFSTLSCHELVVDVSAIRPCRSLAVVFIDLVAVFVDEVLIVAYAAIHGVAP